MLRPLRICDFGIYIFWSTSLMNLTWEVLVQTLALSNISNYINQTVFFSPGILVSYLAHPGNLEVGGWNPRARLVLSRQAPSWSTMTAWLRSVSFLPGKVKRSTHCYGMEWFAKTGHFQTACRSLQMLTVNCRGRALWSQLCSKPPQGSLGTLCLARTMRRHFGRTDSRCRNPKTRWSLLF